MPSASKSKAERLQRSLGFRARAPLAARFEDCTLASTRLTDAIQANRQCSDELRKLAQTCKERLGFWGDDSGASSRLLDYALSCSPTLMRQTDQLLVELHSTLEKGITVSGPPLLPVGDEPIDLNKGRLIALLPEEEEVDAAPIVFLEEAAEIVGCLFKLLPALRDPMEEDEESLATQSWDSYSVEWHQRAMQKATGSFPRASQGLIQRLARSHRRRRQNLLRLRDLSKRAADSLAGSGHAPRSHPIPPTWVRQLRMRADKRSNFADSEVSTGQSQVESILSGKPVHWDKSDTSVANSQVTSIYHQPLTAATVAAAEAVEHFDCPYCYSEMPLAITSNGMTVDEWIEHVYVDLKPYMCTFDNCHRGEKTFSTRKEWFQHELDFHRSRIKWSCGCRESFKDEKGLMHHLKNSHCVSVPENLPFILESCKRYTQDELSTQCALCGILCTSMWDLEDHLARHLEGYALGALPDPDRMDEGSSEGVEHARVREYIEELRQEDLEVPNDAVALTDVQKTGRQSSPQRLIGDVATSRATESSDVLMTDVPDRDLGAGRNIPLDEKVHSFLSTVPVQPRRAKLPPRDEFFVGRALDLRKIHDSLSATGQICTITGRGGSGKTATAIEYLHRYKFEYSYIFWVEAETPGTCQQRYNAIADVLDVGERPSDESSVTASVKSCLSKLDSRWLVVFDNVATWPEIARYIPRNLFRSKGSILITSRSGPTLGGVAAYQHQIGIKLEPWSLDHSREFLLTSISPKLNRNNLQEHDEYHLAERVVSVVDRLPLAVSMVVGYIKVSRCTLAEFLEMWEERATSKRRNRKQADAALEVGIDNTIDSLWDIGIREVRANCRKLLDVLSFLDPEAIPKSLLVGDHEEDYLDFLQASETIQYKRMIEQLVRQRLISLKTTDDGEQAYSIHRVLQQKIQFDMDDYSYADAFRKAFRLIRKQFPSASPTQVPNTDALDPCQKIMPHVYSFDKVFRDHFNDHNSAAMRETKPEDLAELFYDAGFYVWAAQTTAYDGLTFLEAADEILNKINFDPNAKLRADIHCMTGLLLLNMGYAERARGTKRLKRALEIRKVNYEREPSRNNDILLQNAANDYALSLMNEYRFPKAGNFLRECYERYQTWGPESENPFENSKYYGNYSAVLLWEEKIDEAIEYINKCLDYTERFTGGKGSQYYRRLFWLGNVYLQAGETQKALEIHLEVLTERVRLQGKRNENTILSMYAVGAAFHYRADLPSAIEYIEQCIEAAKEYRIPPEAYGRANYHLGLLYEESGQEAKAQPFKEEGIKIFKEFAHYAPEGLREAKPKKESDRIMMIFDDMQGTFQGRYTGHSLLKHMRGVKREPKDGKERQ